MTTGTQTTAPVFATHLTKMIVTSRKQDAICSKRNGMYENYVDVMVRGAFLFMVTAYSKHLRSSMLTRQKMSWDADCIPAVL